MMVRLVSQTFRSIKPHNTVASKSEPAVVSSGPSISPASWCVYLILSTNLPIKTYVGVTNNFSRRCGMRFWIKLGTGRLRLSRSWLQNHVPFETLEIQITPIGALDFKVCYYLLALHYGLC